MTKAVAKSKSTMSLQKVSINSPQAMANFATTLKKFIVDRKLFSSIQGKNYVNVEGWEFAGASVGCFPIVRDTTDLSTEKETKYKARVELVVLSTGKLMGAGEAICSSKEKGKGSFEEYAILSMAQTRAIGKAYRNAFAWLMKMAGYEPTPAEEMVDLADIPDAEPEVMVTPLDEVKERVTARMDIMSTVDRIRMLRPLGRTNLNNLTESNWRRLDKELGTDQVEEEAPNENET